MISFIVAAVLFVVAFYRLDTSFTRDREKMARQAWKLLDENRDLRRERDHLKVQLGRVLNAMHEKNA